MKLNLFKDFDSRPRLIVAIGLAVLVLVILPDSLHLPTRILCAWNSGIDFFLAITWWKMTKANPEKIRRYAESEYEGHLAIFLLVIAAACASVLAIGFLLTDKKGLSTILLTLHVILSIMTIVGSWLLVHTMFAVQYAHSYYKYINRNHSQEIIGGLDFPHNDYPDYWEFLYYSFVVGMTSQVSDVQTTSSDMRRLTLLHGILSFFFNTTILAMSINIIASLI
ncbi:hypothetical protein CDG76_06850 [Nostoc sp. 'Peltigera membranacea cyanobiont' 210A]|uniref:DUF1345 domain-containing protein n=1 Tax=Nostoc sp. 'Peltigera membranacea cyanobiont' 210A TaxID=2014529 RepID=UPI000B9570AF|nr:DUF1345 domain-containing protein [Nostoc sp. 'Peltigera membranacea cyanobiont' 210A]OYD96492.1 hypothetical protein CDG76_06850 [Nostoc sp. 'Peltigera membranacea cyanobiont' 210A]